MWRGILLHCRAAAQAIDGGQPACQSASCDREGQRCRPPPPTAVPNAWALCYTASHRTGRTIWRRGQTTSKPRQEVRMLCAGAASGRARHGCLHALQHIFPSAGPLGLGLLTSSIPPFLLRRLPGGHAVQGDAAVPEAAVRTAQEPQPGPHAAGGAGHDCGALQGAQLLGGLRGARCGRQRCAVPAVVGVPRQQLAARTMLACTALGVDVQTQVYNVPAASPLHRSTWVCRWATPPGPLV